MEKCITCGRELHPERAKKYNYCMSRECQEKNAKGLTMVAVGVNKAAEQYMILDEHTKEELASGKYHDQRRGSFGTSGTAQPAPGTVQPAPGTVQPAPGTAEPAPGVAQPAPGSGASTAVDPQRARRRPAQATRPASKPARQPWSEKQRRLALLYNEQGLRPDEIAAKLGLSSYPVTQIILGSRNRGKLRPATGHCGAGRVRRPPGPPPR